MKYKLFAAPFFNHFIQPSPLPITKSKSLHGVFRVNFPHKNGPILMWHPIHMITSKYPPSNLCALPSSINMTVMMRQHTEFPPNARSPRQT